MYAQMLRSRSQPAPTGAVLGDHEQPMQFGWIQTLVEHDSDAALSLLPGWIGIE